MRRQARSDASPESLQVVKTAFTSPTRSWLSVWLALILLLILFWAVARHLGITHRIGEHLASTILSFGFLLGPLWGFGFGLAEFLHQAVHRPWARRLLPGTLVAPYLIFAWPREIVSWKIAGALLLLVLTISLLLEWAAHADGTAGIRLQWHDGAALLLLGLPVEFHWLAKAFPIGGLAAFPKLLLLDAGLYGFLVIRRVPGVGFDLRLRLRDLLIGVREWAFFAPLAISLGLWSGFIHFHPRIPAPGSAAIALLVTFFFVAIPEEIFFRGLLQNLLETRMPRQGALLVAAAIFGLSHFNKGMTFNFRYVILAAIAGCFYGRAWQDRRRIPCSAFTHTLVDVVWSLWFR